MTSSHVAEGGLRLGASRSQAKQLGSHLQRLDEDVGFHIKQHRAIWEGRMRSSFVFYEIDLTREERHATR